MTKNSWANSTAGDILDKRDLAGLRIFITGVSSGVGLETARALAVRGAAATGTVRDLAHGKEAVANAVAVATQVGGNIETVEIDVVIANAGVMATDFGRTEDGFETQLGTNHLGHFVLIANGGRVVVLSSNSIAAPMSISTIRTSSTSHTNAGSHTTARKPPTSCSQSNSIGGTVREGCGLAQ